MSAGTAIPASWSFLPFYHSRMLFRLKVVARQRFQAYMAARQAAQRSSGSTQ
jgi:heme/copper-type cytochrome/quinol oxidase subunit 2